MGNYSGGTSVKPALFLFLQSRIATTVLQQSNAPFSARRTASALTSWLARSSIYVLYLYEQVILTRGTRWRRAKATGPKHGFPRCLPLKLLTRLFLSKRFNVIFVNIRVSDHQFPRQTHRAHEISPEGLGCDVGATFFLVPITGRP